MLSDSLADAHFKLTDDLRHYSKKEFGYSKEVIDEVKTILSQIDSLRIKLDLSGLGSLTSKEKKKKLDLRNTSE